MTDMDPVETVQEAVREYVGDGDGADESVLAAYDKFVSADALDAFAAFIYTSYEGPWDPVYIATALREHAIKLRKEAMSNDDDKAGPESEEYVEYSRAFWTDNGENLFVDDERYATFEDAVEFTSLRWAGHVYDFVVKRTVTDWEVCVE